MRYASLLVFLAMVGAAAVTGMKFEPGPWYDTLNKPGWTPPSWLFPPVWTVLYAMIAVAGWRVWQVEGLGPLVTVWAVGLILNALWSYLMFGIHRIDLALADVLGMLAAIVTFIAMAWSKDHVAALLFVPYLAWVAFAALLNAVILMLNR